MMGNTRLPSCDGEQISKGPVEDQLDQLRVTTYERIAERLVPDQP